jgi:hypothetical protein
MIEPTESENLEELDRFCDAMIAIRKEIEAATADNPNNVLKNAPHTLMMVTNDNWTYPYTREQAAFPLDYIADNKFPLGNKHKLDAASANTLYNRTHTIHHSNLREYLEKFGYYDVFFIDAETGDIVYSVFKELDFGTSLKTGPYANSSLGKAFRDALSQTDPTKVSMSDYETYLPSYDAPAGFIASAIFDEGKVIGVLAFQISFDEINKVTLLETTKYKTLETYLVGPDFKMRSDSKVDNAQRNVRSSFRNPEKGSITMNIACFRV